MKNTVTFNPAIRVKSVNLEEASIFARKGKRVTADTYRVGKAGAPMVILTTPMGTIKVVNGRTKDKRNACKSYKKALRDMTPKVEAPVVVAPKVKPTKWTLTKVQKVMRLGATGTGNKRVSMYKVENNKGVRKYFVSRKAGQLFIRNAKQTSK